MAMAARGNRGTPMQRRMVSDRFTNLALFLLTLTLTLTGAAGLVFSMEGWLFELHRIAGWGMILLTPWKAALSLRSYRRGPAWRFDRSAGLALSAAFSGLTVAVVAFGLAWKFRLGPETLTIFGYTDTLISWHWILGFALLPLFALHSWRTWLNPRKGDFLSRRAALRFSGLALAGIVGWILGESVAGARESPSAKRRPSGSREEGSFSGNDFPVTTGAGDGRVRLDPKEFTLSIQVAEQESRQFSYHQLLDYPQQTVEALLDCTIGWYTVQAWRGLAVSELLREVAAPFDPWALRVIAHSGYSHLFFPWEWEDLLLATHVGGQPLAHRHGGPLRLVAPGRRGWFWVKWVEKIELIRNIG